MELVERVVKAKEYNRQVYGELHEHPINLDTLFDTLIAAVRHQYAGYMHKRQYYTPAEYHTYVFTHYRYQNLTYEMLVRSLQQFVGDMHDRHLQLHCDDWIDYRNLTAGYQVRPFEDVLYVTRAADDCELVKGDRILEIQGLTPEKVRKLTRRNSFYSREPEREIWDDYLRMAESLKVKHADGTEEILRMRLRPADESRSSAASPGAHQGACIRQLGDDTIYLQINRLERAALSDLLAARRADLESCSRLILDLRQCSGGETGAGWELFPYLLTEEKQLRELIADEGSYVNCTRENCGIRISQLSAYRSLLAESSPDDPDLSEKLLLLDEELAFYQENKGRGFVFKAPETVEDDVIRPASHAPGKIIILTDTRCENEGEEFLSMCRRCGEKVTLLGRPTMGNLDYFDNIDLQLHDHMVLSYPIKMTKAAWEGRGISEKGIIPDICIAWTPEEIREDVLLRRAADPVL